MRLSRFITVSMIAIVLVAVYFVGYKDGKLGTHDFAKLTVDAGVRQLGQGGMVALDVELL